MIRLQAVTVTGRLQDISLNLTSGQCVHLIGANGAGKSSLLTVLAGLLDIDSGQYLLLNNAINTYQPAELAYYRTFLEQDYHCAFPLTVAELLDYYSGGSHIDDSLAAALEISAFYHRPLTALSGGELQRVHLARVLLQLWPQIEHGQALLLLDEPLQGLDYRHQHQLLTLLNALAIKGNLVVMSSHDLTMSFDYADRLVLLKNQRLLACDTVGELVESTRLAETLDCRVHWLYDSNGRCAVRTEPD
ncbi:Iron-chelate-transporting ATPase [Saliniradius amylolyticus]|uniref:Iron-chelate-transporting ATPase n=1 Tax=Saliniradius amylolyticus TaxID=2183582 RepID=A0A2S2E2E6_9ALTE|nr:ATP-binding cassette domain-containing protein [Saliniradius amylolyticus]AWL11818.1 Iron-chelate-transporting ATPase [Saliniradius amylolyticus]